MRAGWGIAAILVFWAAGCQTPAAQENAVLPVGDKASLAILKSTVAKAIGVATIELGVDDPTKSSTFTVLPPRPTNQEDRSLARPTLFRIVLINDKCAVIREDTGETYFLDGARCLPSTGRKLP